MTGQNIGQQIGYWEALAERREDKKRKVEVFVRRAKSCRTFDGLEKVGDEARKAGLWHPVAVAFGECNARLRGRHAPVRYRKGKAIVTVSDNKVIEMPWITARTLCQEGWQYAGQAD